MSDKMSAAEFRKLNKKPIFTTPTNTTEQRNGRVKEEKDSKLTTKEALRSMGHYFELDEKKVAFWIKQMEFSKKI